MSRKKIPVTASVGDGAPFKVELTMRDETTPTFRITNIDGPLDTAWLRDLVLMLQEAEVVAQRLDNSPPLIKKRGA
jgi:hypothetical protein